MGSCIIPAFCFLFASEDDFFFNFKLGNNKICLSMNECKNLNKKLKILNVFMDKNFIFLFYLFFHRRVCTNKLLIMNVCIFWGWIVFWAINLVLFGICTMEYYFITPYLKMISHCSSLLYFDICSIYNIILFWLCQSHQCRQNLGTYHSWFDMWLLPSNFIVNV